MDGAGKSETVNLLNEWMDPRWIVTRAFGEPSDEERSGPSTGAIGGPATARARRACFSARGIRRHFWIGSHRRIKPAEFDDALSRIAQFEKALADDGALILKFWMHLSRARPEETAEKSSSGIR